jgi:phosphoenolpyruvate carboxylase
VSTAEEVEEAAVAYLAYRRGGVIVGRKGYSLFAAKAISLGIPLGERYFITPRMPNLRLEDFEHNMSALEVSVLAKSYSRNAAVR